MKKTLFVTCTIIYALCSAALIAGDKTTEAEDEQSSEKAENVPQATTDIANAFDIEAGKKLYKKTCKNCHGPTAKGMASFPKLADKEPDYLIERLSQYRAGEQVGPNTPLMAPQAANLSDEDIINISHFIASLNQ